MQVQQCGISTINLLLYPISFNLFVLIFAHFRKKVCWCKYRNFAQNQIRQKSNMRKNIEAVQETRLVLLVLRKTQYMQKLVSNVYLSNFIISLQCVPIKTNSLEGIQHLYFRFSLLKIYFYASGYLLAVVNAIGCEMHDEESRTVITANFFGRKC